MTAVLGFFFALSVSSPVVPACAVDPATGLPLPRTARAACVVAQTDRTLLVQRSDEGLLIAAIDGVSGSAQLDAPGARIIFCPSTLLEFGSGRPAPACVSGEGLAPGKEALVGTGSVRASVGPGGSASASRVVGQVVTSSGARFELTGSLVALGRETYDRIELGYAGTSPAQSQADVSDRREVIEQLMRLDDDQFRAVEAMLSLTPRDWEVVRAIVEDGAGGEQASPDLLPKDRVPIDPQVEGLPEIINTILARVNSIGSNVTSLINRVPDRGDVRSLVSQIDLGPLREMLGDVHDTVQGLVDITRELRDGFDTFDAAAFRTRVGTVLTDLEQASSLYQRMLCFEDPDLTIRQISLTPLRRLIDRTPPVVLYALSRILENVDPSWDQRIGGFIDAVPPEVTSMCNNGGAQVSPRALDTANLKCKALRSEGVGIGMGRAKAAAGIGLVFFRFVKNHTEEDLSLTLGAVVVGGGTAGTVKKNPEYAFIEGVVEKFENGRDFLDKLTDLRKDCLDQDHDVESDLNDCAKEDCNCTVPLSVLLQGAVVPSYAYVTNLIDERITQATSAGVGDTAGARAKLDLATDADHDGTAAGYGLVCQAYKLLQSTSGTPPAAPSLPRIKRPTAPVKTQRR